MPKRRRQASKSRGTPLGVWITAFSLVAVAGTSAYAAGFSLEDDTAVIVGSDGTIYSLDLTSGVATAGATLSGDTPADTSGVEADPTTDTLYLIDTTPALISATPADGTGTYIEDDYTNLEVLDGLARTDDGVMYLSHIPAGQATAHISTLNLTTGVYTSSQEIDIAGGGGNKRMLALAWADDTLYGFALGEDDAMYSIDPATGVATLERAKGTGDLVGEAVLGADTTADGTIYILGFPDSEEAVLYTTDPNGSTTKVADITGLGGTEIAENLAIATLLDSERVEDDSGDSGDSAGSSESDSDSDEEDTPAPAVVPPPAPAPVPAPTPAPELEPVEEPVQEAPAAPVTEEPGPVPEPEPKLEPEPVALGDPALFPLPWVVGMLALLVGALFGVFFWFATRRERQLRANR